MEERAKRTLISDLIWIIYINCEYIYDMYIYIDVNFYINMQNDFPHYVTKNLNSLFQLTPDLLPIFGKKSGRKTHKGRCYGLYFRNDVRWIQLGLEGIGSSRQVEALEGVQTAVMSCQIAKLIVALAESELRWLTEQESISANKSKNKS